MNLGQDLVILEQDLMYRDLHDQWWRFKREFTQLLTAVGKGTVDEKVKLAMFLRTVGSRVNDMYETIYIDAVRGG